MSRSTDLRRIPGQLLRECRCFEEEFPGDELCERCIAANRLANHADAIVALIEACEEMRDALPLSVEAALAAVHAVRDEP